MKYLYKCYGCDNEFDVELKLKHVLNSAKFPKHRCPVCKGVARKISHPIPVHYKGTGFYSTDSKKEVK